MKPQEIKLIARKIRKGASLISFTYSKENGETSKRILNVGANLGKAFEKRGIQITGKGNWHTGAAHGKNAFYIRKGKGAGKMGEFYIRGIDMKSPNDPPKIFKLSGITELK